MSDDLARRIANDYKGKILDGYEVQSLHRKGGTSVVLLATKDSDLAAIKIYSQELFDESGIEKERIERQVSTKHLQHPNLVRTLGAGVCPSHGYHFLIMDFIGDPTITEKINELTADQIRLVIRQTAKAALFMHETLQQVHRDIKPDNIAVRQADTHVTLLDLGLVRPVTGATVTDSGVKHVKGTKEYAPPELLDNRVTFDHDGWLAVTYYQLGATLYQMLTRRAPFADYEGDQLLNAIRHTTLTIESSEAPPDLVKLSLDCLSKDPGQRLALVNWNRFLNDPDETSQLEELSDLMTTLPKASVAASAFPDGAPEKQRLKRILAEISNEVELSIRSFLSGNARLFPGYTIARHEAFETETAFAFVVEFDFANLVDRVTAYSVIVMEIADASSRMCECMLHTSSSVPEVPLCRKDFRTVYEGAFVLTEFRRRIGNELARDLKDLLSP